MLATGLWVLTLVAGVGAVGLPEAPDGWIPVPTRASLNPTEAELVGSSGPWSLWRTMEIRGRGIVMERVYVCRFYRQRVGRSTAERVFDWRSPHQPTVFAVLSDGSVYIYDQGLVRIDPSGNRWWLKVPMPGGVGKPGVLAVVEQGVFVQKRPKVHAGGVRPALPVFFVPFRGGELDAEAAIEVSPPGGLAPRPVLPVVTSGTEVAWMDEHGLRVLETVSGSVREVPVDLRLRGVLAKLRVPMAFDGRFYAGSGGVIDTHSGRYLTDLAGTVLGLKDGVAYELVKQGKKLAVVARSLHKGKGSKPATLATFGGFSIYQMNNRLMPLHPASRKRTGLLAGEVLKVFDGRRWTEIPVGGL